MRIRPVAADQWDVVAWLWQAFRTDLSEVVDGLPRPDGRFAHGPLDPFPGPDNGGYLAWRDSEHGEVPVGFSLVAGLEGERRSIVGFWVVPAARRGGTGTALALDTIARHDGPWDIAFQHANVGAGHFWRRVAGRAFGPEGTAWTEERHAVPGKPDVPADHWIHAPG